ncbi:hypothetical protein P7C70_g8292, partial [Phenoliferia sp. Uapishka_3]
MASRQDEAYRSRTTDYVQELRENEVQKVRQDNDNAISGYGNTLGTLRLLNKEFCELGSRPLFSTVDATRIFDPIFRFRILKLYASSIERIDFAERTTNLQTSQIITFLDRFTNLRRLDFRSPQTVDFILGQYWQEDNRSSISPFRAGDPNIAFASQTFRETAVQIEELYLGELWTNWDGPGFICHFQNLRLLSLSAGVISDVGERWEGHLAREVKSMQLLEVLILGVGEHASPEVGPAWYTGWPSTCRIRRIKIEAYRLTCSMWRLVEAIGASLEDLELNIFELDANFAAALPPLQDTCITFPKLSRLSLHGAFSNSADEPVKPLLDRLASSSVALLDIGIRLDTTLPLTLPYFPTVKHIFIDHKNTNREKNTEQVYRSSTLCAAKGIRCNLTSFFYPSTRTSDLLHHPPSSPEKSGQSLDFAAIHRTLEFGMRRLERAKLDDDLNWDIERAMLEPLERLRLVWDG